MHVKMVIFVVFVWDYDLQQLLPDHNDIMQQWHNPQFILWALNSLAKPELSLENDPSQRVD